MRIALSAAILFIPFALPAQGDTVRLGPEAGLLDGLRYRNHALATTVTRTHGDSTLSKVQIAIDVTHETQQGRTVVRAVTGALAGAPDPGFRAVALLDARTTMPLSYEVHSGNGGMISVTFEGTHIVGQRRPASDSAVQPVDLNLSEPAFLGAYEDAALDAVHLRLGMVLRVPVVSISPGGISQVRQFIYRVIRRDTVSLGNRQVPAWVVESRDSLNTNTIWLVDEPPYTTTWRRMAASGRVTDLEQVVRGGRP